MKSSKNIVEEYLKQQDWRVKENSNSPYSYGSLGKHIVAEVSKDYWLREVYPEYISKEYLDGTIHIHDLGGLTLYCCGKRNDDYRTYQRQHRDRARVLRSPDGLQGDHRYAGKYE